MTTEWPTRPTRPSDQLRWHRIWIGLGVALMTGVLWLALRPDPGMPLDFPGADKLLHAATFTGLMGWWGNVYSQRRARAWAAMGCLAFGVFIELAQWLSPPRDADPVDVLADGFGILLALLLLRTPLANVLASLEVRLVHRHRRG